MTGETSASHLVVGVARLGETDLAGWWRSHGLDAVGDYVLPDLFPRTAPIVGAELAVLSAAKRHVDALPDRDDIVHLFGEPLPAFAQAIAWLAELKTGGDASFLQQLRGWNTVEEARAGLAKLSGEPPPGERIGGTFRLGRLWVEDLADPVHAETISKALAAAYAGQGRTLAVPYFDLA